MILAGLLSALLFSSCSLLGDDGSRREVLEGQRRVWKEQDLSQYQYTLSVQCFCPTWSTPATIKVRADTVVAVLDPHTGDTLRHPNTGRAALEEAPDRFPPVPGLFDVVERALGEDYHQLSVQYSDEYGYPTRIDFEIYENATDDEVLYEVRAFEPHLHSE